MGTNYYLSLPDEDEPLHIGKSSAGWCFALHVIPERDILDLCDWLPLFERGEIRDEYGRPLTAQEMIGRITQRASWAPSTSPTPDWYAANHAAPGPHGLARHKLGWHCVRHGEGTWDCCIGDFS